MSHYLKEGYRCLINLNSFINSRFQISLFHSCLYRYYCLDEVIHTKPDIPPYYSKGFFDIIKKVVQDTPLNPVHMTVKQWYDYLLELEVTMELDGADGRLAQKKSRVEMLYPNNSWADIYHFSKLQGLSTESRTFNFKLINQLLPVNARLNQLLPNNRSDCTMCRSGQPETILHALFECESNKEAEEALITLTRPYDSNFTAEKALLLYLSICDTIYELPTILVLSTGLNFIWQNRVSKKSTALYQIRAELECLVSLLRRSRRRRLREASKMVNNSLSNFAI